MKYPFYTVVDSDFSSVNQLIINRLSSHVPLVEEISSYLIDAGGKRLRPLLVLLASKAAGFMRHALEDKHKMDKANEAIKVHMDTLDLIFRNGLKKEDQTGIQLIKDLHAMLLKYDIRPGA